VTAHRRTGDQKMEVPPTRPQPVYRDYSPPPPQQRYTRGGPQLAPHQPPVPGPPPRSRWTARRQRRLAFAVGAGAAVLVIVAAVIGSQHRAASAASADHGQVAPHCYATVTDAFGDAVTLGVLGTSDCTTVAADVQASMPPGFTATPNTPEGTGTAACWGTVAGYAVSVIDPEENPQNAVCSDLDFSAVP
jgi:hypothetical protein